MLSFSEGGVLGETDTWLTPNSNTFTLNWPRNPFPVGINGSDGVGNWERLSPGEVTVNLRKLLYQGSGLSFQHIGDFWAKGSIIASSGLLKVKWTQLWMVDKGDNLLIDFGIGTSEGTRI